MKGIVDGERFADARAVADAVLYEGYLLYPYRASATKNRLRWQFGVVVPPAFAAADPSERASVTVGVVVEPGGRAVLTGVLRFLQLCTHRTDDETVDGGCWDEGEVREVEVGPIAVRPGEYGRQRRPFHVAGDAERRVIDGTVAVTVRPAGDDRTLLAVAITVTNEVAWEPSVAGREEAVRHSLVGAHLLLAVDDGRFLSSIDPPAGAAVAVAGCTNEGLFPVLVGSADRDDMMLAAPIILYDHPEVAPESPGDMFDATEIDEILALRVLTLTDDEKAQARRTDPRAAAIVDRCDDLPPELWSRLHGAIRTLRPTDASPPADDDAPWWDPGVDEQFDPFTDTLRVAGVAVTAGSTVTLHPLRRADAHDMFFSGRRATVGGVFRDVDGEVLVGVTIDDDPASEALAWQRRMLFFHPDEIAIE